MAVTIEEVTAEVPRETPTPSDERAPAVAPVSPDMLRRLQEQLLLQAERAARVSTD